MKDLTMSMPENEAHIQGLIPAGVAKEIVKAKECEKAVFELPSGVFRRTLSVDGTREFLLECGR